MYSSPIEYNLRFKYIPNRKLWDCTDGKLHGGGKTIEESLTSYLDSKASEEFDNTVGWAG